jgi:hypothetical protein
LLEAVVAVMDTTPEVVVAAVRAWFSLEHYQ